MINNPKHFIDLQKTANVMFTASRQNVQFKFPAETVVGGCKPRANYDIFWRSIEVFE